jgi:hypothetical protein
MASLKRRLTMFRWPVRRWRAACVAAVLAGLVVTGCGGDGERPAAQVEHVVRAVYSLGDLYGSEKTTKPELVRARARFCGAVAIAVFAPRGERVPGRLSRPRVPPASACRRAFDDGELAKNIGPLRLTDVGPIRIRGARATVALRLAVTGQRGSQRSGLAAVRMGGRWRAVLPCEIIGCDASLLPVFRALRPRPKVIDEDAGRYRGTAIGARRAAALRRQGPAPTVRSGEGSGPLGSDLYDDGTPSSWDPPGDHRFDQSDLRYRGRSYLISNKRRPAVYGFIVTDRRAQTARGVGIGDTLAFARKRYPGLHCDLVNEGSEYTAFPSCRTRLAPGRYLGFGQNPIRSITVMRVPFDEPTPPPG